MFENFKNKKVLIIGDVMIDEYIYGDVNRISPEAPVQIVDYTTKEFRLGGAANVAMNIKGLGAIPIICSVVGEKNKKLFSLLDENTIRKFIHVSEERETTYKTRIISGSSHMLRLDFESKHNLSERENFHLLNLFDLAIESEIDVVVLSDYDKGVLNSKNIQRIIEKCKELDIPVIVDPKKNNFYEYSGATIFKPNLKELKEGVKEFYGLEDIDSYREELDVENLMLTLSEDGIKYCTKDYIHEQPAYKKEIVDVSGAGDAVTATLALLYSDGFDGESIVKICNLAGGLACDKIGVNPITLEQLEEEYEKYFS